MVRTPSLPGNDDLLPVQYFDRFGHGARPRLTCPRKATRRRLRISPTRSRGHSSECLLSNVAAYSSVLLTPSVCSGVVDYGVHEMTRRMSWLGVTAPEGAWFSGPSHPLSATKNGLIFRCLEVRIGPRAPCGTEHGGVFDFPPLALCHPRVFHKRKWTALLGSPPPGSGDGAVLSSICIHLDPSGAENRRRVGLMSAPLRRHTLVQYECLE